MSLYNKIIETTADPCVKPKEKSPGIYDGTPGYPPRTPSPNAEPEKFYESMKSSIRGDKE